MAAKKKSESAGATGTVRARRQAEKERQAAARAERAAVVAETVAAQKATAKFLENKPADSRTMDRAKPTE
jgi:hypothetical protein